MRIFTVFLLFLGLAITPAAANPKAFPVAPHSDVTIEWWYVNAHVITRSGHHLAMIGSFFRFGNAQGQLAEDSSAKARQSHYLIWAVTDEDHGTHRAYSLADNNTLILLQQAAALAAMADPNSQKTQALLQALGKGELPPPTKLIAGVASVSGSPFAARFGKSYQLVAVAGRPNTYRLTLGVAGDADHIDFTFQPAKPPMYVGGNGDTGIYKPTDMHYVSLTRFTVAGKINGENVASGQGWFDHQWGDSWTTEHVGWDWWGAQLSNGTDVLFFRQRDLATGRIFQPLATFEDKSGHVTVTKDIRFTPDPNNAWKSPETGTIYPLGWTISFPTQNITLHLTPDIPDQEMPVLASGGAIWEGSCHIAGTDSHGQPIAGVAYQELVGYNAPAVRAQMQKLAQSVSAPD